MDRSPISSPKDPSASVEPFTVTITTARAFASVMLAGELDIAGCSTLEAAVSRLERTEPERLVVDLSRLSFLDCAGLECILAIDDRCRADGRTLLLIPGPSPVQRLFRLTGTEERLRFASQGPSTGLQWRSRPMRRARARPYAREE